MLIVNADDFGRSQTETDVAARCFSMGRITSTTAMVYMHDSERAAGIAADIGIGVGLHLNLSERFTAGSVGPALRRSHEKVVRFLKTSRYALVFYHPLLREDFRAVVDAQLEEFRRLYRRPPTHVDGHQHQHLCTNVLLDGLIPRGFRVRRSFCFSRNEKGPVNRAYRAWVDRRLAKNHRICDFFFSLGQCLQLGKAAKVLELARGASVELMTHPIETTEYEYLMGREYGTALEALTRGPYSSL